VSSRFGENLRAARLKAGLTQMDLMRRLGFRRTTPISIWERGYKFPSPKTITKLAEGIGCETAELMEGVETPYDRLRGSIGVAGQQLRDEDRPMYRAWLLFSPALQRRYTATFAEIAESRAPRGGSATPRARAPVASVAREAGAPRASARRRRS